MLIVGIESSCDETGIAIVENGESVIANSIEYQDEIHKEYGGVVPEFAARHHAEKIGILFKKAIAKADIKTSDINAIGVVNGPGLVGSLLVGFMFARGLSCQLNIPLIPVNHILAHLYVPKMIYPNEISYPHYAVLVSGGHTFIIKANSILGYEILAKTRDDAIGEGFDKISHFLGLGYPGGAVIDKIAAKGNENGFKFPETHFKKKTLDFSFSGLKAAAIRMIKKEKPTGIRLNDFLASFQQAAFDIVFNSLEKLLAERFLPQIVFGGGVAANSYLRDRAKTLEKKYNVRVFFPPKEYCGDNGAMVGGLAYHLYNADVRFKGEDVFSRSDFRKLY
jgi:N6-L-threonylcarbamoyladenine synthase